jgi:penicillin-binding protein 1C
MTRLRRLLPIGRSEDRPLLHARWSPRTLVRGLLIVATCLLGLRFWPHASLQARVAVSTGVWSADGELLRVTLAADEQYRLWVPLDEISPTLVDAMLLKEDRWFYVHPGVNPVALGRAAYRTYSSGDRQGGSTLTMQLARLLYRLNTKTPAGKAKQAALALWLECRYSKHDLLEAYLNVAPFGGNIEGVGAASRIFFGKSPDRLTLGESLTLAVIPQRPAGRAGRTAGADDMLAAREKLGRAWLQTHRASGDRADADRRQVELPIVARPDYTLPWKAAHFVDALLAAGSPGGRVDTTLDSRLQRVLETQIAQFIAERGDNGLRNAAALLVDTRDMGVKAWVGAADYWNARDGQVNGVLAKRSPGSALKPFIYALALDQGVLHPRTMVRDAPSAFGPFTPENFDGRFVGPIAAQDALIRSRNIPAVWAASQLTQPTLYQFLEGAGIRDLKPEAFYGLALALGGGEVTMEELAGLYAMLANGGVLKPIRMTVRGDRLSAPNSAGVRLISPEASFITLDMLRQNARPGDTGLVPVRTRWPVAWKTGTSWGFRDAWTAGVAGPYVLVVWIGNFSGEGNPAFVGIDAAAPLFFRMVDGLNLARPDEDTSLPAPPAGVSSVAVCVGSGDLPNADCPHTVDTWYIPGKSPIRVSQLHRAVALDAVTGAPICAPYPAATRFEVFEFWSSDMLTLFREAGMPRRVPPPLPACALDDRMEPPRIASPMRNVSYALRSSTRDAIPLEASVAADVQRLFWFDGNALIGSRTPSDGPLSWRPATAGTRIVRVVDDHGRSADRDVTVTIRR